MPANTEASSEQYVEVVLALMWRESVNGPQFYLQQRPSADGAIIWEFPGGKVEPSENVATALLREVKEELDLDLALEQLQFFSTYCFDYADKRVRLHTFLVEVPSLNLPRWFSLKEMIEPSFPLIAGSRQIVQSLAKKWSEAWL